MNTVGIALVGAGPWGRTLGGAVSRLPGVELRWICELDPDRRATAATIAPGARLTANLDESLADPQVVAVLVAVDSASHHPVGLRVLEANRHLLVEKPMALTVADAADLSRAAENRRRVLAVGHLLLHHPAVRRARALISDGVLGEPLWMETTRRAPGRARGGGAWWTLAPHDVSLALHLFDAVPVAVTAVSSGPRAGAGCEVAWATLHFADGRLAHIQVARGAAEKKRGFQVVGSRRCLSFDELVPGLRIHDPRRAHPDVEEPLAEIDALSAQCLHFVGGVARNDTSAGNGPHALAVVRVLEAGSRSMAEGGAPVSLA